MDISEENVQALLNMGFPSENIRYALQIGKNDLSEAVAILTSEDPNDMKMQFENTTPEVSYQRDINITSQMAPPPSYEEITNQHDTAAKNVSICISTHLLVLLPCNHCISN